MNEHPVSYWVEKVEQLLADAIEDGVWVELEIEEGIYGNTSRPRLIMATNSDIREVTIP